MVRREEVESSGQKARMKLDRLRSRRAKARYAGYFAVLLVMIVLTDILDNLATNIGGNITSSFITEFFVNGTVFGKSYGYEAGLALHNTISLIGYVMALFVSFYKSLADRIGRKPLFALTSLGMAVGLLIIFSCRSYPVFLIGSFMLSFFTGGDIQILYVLEEAPKEKRATVYSLLKGLGGLSSVAIPAMRATLMKNDPTQWRNIYLPPGLFGIAVAVLIVFLVKETRIFQDRRIAQLEEAIKTAPGPAAEEVSATRVKAGILPAIRYIFKRKDLRTLILIKMLFDAAIIAMMNYESIMYRANMSTEAITTAEFFYPFIYCGAVMLSGLLADRIGRKKNGIDLRADLRGIVLDLCPERQPSLESDAGRHCLWAVSGGLLDRQGLYGDHLHGDGTYPDPGIHHRRGGASGLYRDGSGLCLCQYRHPFPAAVAGLQRFCAALYSDFHFPVEEQGEGNHGRGL